MIGAPDWVPFFCMLLSVSCKGGHMTKSEAIHQLAGLHREELGKLDPKAKVAKMANLLAKYRAEHPEESTAWSLQYE